MKAQAGLGIAIVACALGGCASPAALTTESRVTLTQDAPVVSVVFPTAYAYRLHIVRGGECPSGFELKTQYGVPVVIDESTGVVGLIPGNYTGKSGYAVGFGTAFASIPCDWMLTLTPQTSGPGFH